jgi:hypothetical protein
MGNPAHYTRYLHAGKAYHCLDGINDFYEARLPDFILVFPMLFFWRTTMMNNQND